MSVLLFYFWLPDIPGSMNIVTEGPGRHGFAVSPNDVVCCVKRFLADHALSQEFVNSCSTASQASKIISY